jgi:uncharacterized protein (TIGR00725 family)
MTSPTRVSVIGGSTVTDRQYDQARAVGRQLGEAGYDLVCGGRGGVMEAACRGIGETGGHSIGILPGRDPGAANDYVDTVITTGIGNARNPIVVMNGAGVIAVDGGPGTLSELGHALDFGRPVAGIDTHSIDGVTHADSPQAAIDYVLGQIEG